MAFLQADVEVALKVLLDIVEAMRGSPMYSAAEIFGMYAATNAAIEVLKEATTGKAFAPSRMEECDRVRIAIFRLLDLGAEDGMTKGQAAYNAIGGIGLIRASLEADIEGGISEPEALHTDD